MALIRIRCRASARCGLKWFDIVFTVEARTSAGFELVLGGILESEGMTSSLI